MLDYVESIFNDLPAMLKRLKKDTYKQNMEKFREKNDHHFMEMVSYVENEEDKDAATKQISAIIVTAVKERFGKSGKVKGRTLTDLNFFMIYYVFPAILLLDNEVSSIMAEQLKDTWNASFKGCSISYTTYDLLYDSFQDKLLGIF